MNERIKKLWKQAGIYDGREGLYWCSQEQLEKFAESIIRECADWIDRQDESRCPYGVDLIEHFGVKE